MKLYPYAIGIFLYMAHFNENWQEIVISAMKSKCIKFGISEHPQTDSSFWAEGLPEAMHSPYCMRLRLPGSETCLPHLTEPSECEDALFHIWQTWRLSPSKCLAKSAEKIVLLMWSLLKDMRKAGPGSPQLPPDHPSWKPLGIWPPGITDKGLNKITADKALCTHTVTRPAHVQDYWHRYYCG